MTNKETIKSLNEGEEVLSITDKKLIKKIKSGEKEKIDSMKQYNRNEKW